jgi:hypothetical protein
MKGIFTRMMMLLAVMIIIATSTHANSQSNSASCISCHKDTNQPSKTTPTKQSLNQICNDANHKNLPACKQEDSSKEK